MTTMFIFFFRRLNIVVLNADNFRKSRNREILSFMQMADRNHMLFHQSPDTHPILLFYDNYDIDWLQKMEHIPFPKKAGTASD